MTSRSTWSLRVGVSALVCVLIVGAVTWWGRIDSGSRPDPGSTSESWTMPPVAPTGLTVDSKSTSSVALRWNTVARARSYDVYADGKYVASTRAIKSTIARLVPASTTFWQVVATNEAGFSPKSDPLQVTLEDQSVGPSVPLGDLPGWRQIFVEDFTEPAPLGSFTSVYGDKWSAYQEPWRDTSGRGLYSPGRTMSVSDGRLNIRVHSEGGQPYVAAPQPRLNGPGTPAWEGVLYGRFSVRFRADAVSGFKTAWLLWPDSDSWPDDGEIDFPEGPLHGTIAAYAHFASESGGMESFNTEVSYADWHVATTEWTPGRVTFILDGTVIGQSTTLVPSRPMHFVLQTETVPSRRALSHDAAADVEVDWFTAYAMK